VLLTLLSKLVLVEDNIKETLLPAESTPSWTVPKNLFKRHLISKANIPVALGMAVILATVSVDKNNHH
jgi:hypothetical protein